MAARDPALEVFRGIAICEVVVHHVTGFARINVHPDTPSHLFYAAVNRTLHFAVPALLFLTAVLLTRAMVGSQRTWREFYTRRGQQILVPYLIWSMAYAAFALWQGKTTVEALQSPETWRHWLVWGKAWFHLYFLVILLQLYLVFPLLLRFMQRVNPSLPVVLLGAAALQFALYWVNYHWLRAAYPSTALYWHVIAVAAGVWVGLHLDEPIPLRWAVLPLVGGLAWYLPQGLAELRGGPLNTLAYQVAYWTYTTGMCFGLLAFCRWLVRRGGWAVRGLQALGVQSMQIYLVHPMLLFLWYATPQSGTTLRFHLTVLIATLTALGVSLAISRLAARTRLGTIVFGRGDVPLTPLPGPARG